MGKYSLETGGKIIKTPSHVFEIPGVIMKDLRQIPHRLNQYWYNSKYGNLGEDFITKEWDNLIILDAARPDMISESGGIGGKEMETRFSPGSASSDFIESQFVGRDLTDTIYITANPHLTKIPEGTFNKTVNLLRDRWDQEYNTVLPETVVGASIECHEENPDKRLIIHFMQPHFPFLGPAGEHLSGGIGDDIHDESTGNPWKEQTRGMNPDSDRLLEAYRENHEIVIPHAEELVEKLPGRSIVTADHTNLVGERGFPIPIRMYGHPHYFPHPGLIEVPWIVFDGERREAVAESPENQTTPNNDVVEERLEAFGYI